MSCEKCGKTQRGQNYAFFFATKFGTDLREGHARLTYITRYSIGERAEAFICDRCVAEKAGFEQIPRFVYGGFAVLFIFFGLTTVPSGIAIGDLQGTVLLALFSLFGFLVCARFFYRFRKYDEKNYHENALLALRIKPDRGSKLAIQSVRKKYEEKGANKFWTPDEYDSFRTTTTLL
jgi:hypothetical protein